ncbi:uncharacterized protein LOC6583634 isoform X2 [Drosophila mojavensis]|nr:uncharacterized protein LOC6583634 isoform X2 [Drosophila mojavensis]EDW19776.2 uncharacterized protein Dmoj_GI11320, isoform A [Drosophila mojavensis]
MWGLPRQDSNVCHVPQERKINPLGKPNKMFLGRTINSAIRHNRRTTERTRANCQQKLQELDSRHKRRKENVFYNRCIREELNGTRERKSRSSNNLKQRRSSRSSSREYRCRSRGHKKKHRKTKKKSKRRHHRKSPSSELAVPSPEKLSNPASDDIAFNNLALAVSMAYSRPLYQTPANRPLPFVLSSTDIVKELMSDDETLKQDIQLDELSIASSCDEIPAILTIDVSSQDEQSDGCERYDGESESDNSSCMNLTIVDSESDIEIIESKVEQTKEEPSSLELTHSLELRYTTDIALTVDLTED